MRAAEAAVAKGNQGAPGIPGGDGRGEERMMEALLVIIGVVAVWYLIQGVVLPRMGIST